MSNIIIYLSQTLLYIYVHTYIPDLRLLKTISGWNKYIPAYALHIVITLYNIVTCFSIYIKYLCVKQCAQISFMKY